MEPNERLARGDGIAVFDQPLDDPAAMGGRHLE